MSQNNIIGDVESGVTPSGISFNSNAAVESDQRRTSGPVIDGDEETIAGANGETVGGEEKVEPPTPYTFKQILIIITLCALSTSSAMFYSLLAPFFPTEATKVKGATELEVGLIFSSFPFINFFLCPIFGYHINTIGSKFLVVAGNFVCSFCAILFGCLQWCPPGRIFVIMCFVTRIIESIGGAAQNTASYAIAANTFPKRISSVLGFLQAATCIGLMAGPPIGGTLYAYGGYHMPFMVTGGIFMAFTLVCIFLLPNPEDTPSNSAPLWLKLKIARLPVVMVIGYTLFMGQFAMGFFDTALALHLNQDIKPSLSTVYVGLVFLVPAALVVVIAPLCGVLTDKFKWLARPYLLVGTFLAGVGFLVIGPAPFLTFIPKSAVWVVIVAFVILSFGWGSFVVPYPQFYAAARREGLPDNMETQGLVSGINGAYNSMGSLLGPTVGGIAMQQIGFQLSCTVLAGMAFLGAIMMGVYMVATATCCPEKDLPQEEDETKVEAPGERTNLLNNQNGVRTYDSERTHLLTNQEDNHSIQTVE